MHDLRVVSNGSRSFERGGEDWSMYANPYTRDRELRRDTIYTDFGRHQFGITARETRDTTSKTARHATVRFSPRETRPRFRGHPVPRRRIYHRDTIELELPEIIPSPPIAVVVMPRQTTLVRVYIYVCVSPFSILFHLLIPERANPLVIPKNSGLDYNQSFQIHRQFARGAPAPGSIKSRQRRFDA